MGPMNFTDPELRNNVIFRGPAKLFDQFDNPEFQEFAAKHGIKPDTKIAVARKGKEGGFGVIKV